MQDRVRRTDQPCPECGRNLLAVEVAGTHQMTGSVYFSAPRPRCDGCGAAFPSTWQFPQHTQLTSDSLWN